MSESNTPQKFTETIEQMSQDLSVEQMRLLQDYFNKKVEMHAAKEAFEHALELDDGGDEQTSESLGNIQRVLSDQSFRLSSSECVLLACLRKQLEGDDFTDTKKINIILHHLKRKPSNTTKVVDSLEKKEMLEIRSDGLHAHKMYRLTDKGQRHVGALLDRLTGEDGGDRLSVVSNA